MRVAVLAFTGLVGLAMLPGTAGAFPYAPGRAEIGSTPYYQEVAQGCGPGFHWVGRHRNRYGAWVPGRCVRN
jgi:hypothetical protein